MIRTGMTCLALSLIAGCAAPVSLEPVPPPSSARPVAPPVQNVAPDGGSVQVFPIDRSGSMAPAVTPPALSRGADSPASADAARERLRGVLSAQGWQLCGQNAPKPMRVSPEARAALESFLVHQPIFFLDGWGREVGQDLELESVERMLVDGPGCREPLESFIWVAYGRDPYWAFAITEAGMQLRTQGEAPRGYAYAVPQSDGKQIVYAGSDYRLTLYRHVCTGAGQGDARYAWSAELYAAGQQWRGCAWQGLQNGQDEEEAGL